MTTARFGKKTPLMKKVILTVAISALTLGVHAGDWGKAPVECKAPIEECVDVGGNISFGYHTDYLYNGVRFGRDSLVTDVNYSFESFIPMTVGVTYKNVIGGAPGVDHMELYLLGQLGTYAGFDLTGSFRYHFFPELAGVGSAAEFGLHLSRDLAGIATFKASMLYNHGYPNSWNIGGATGATRNDNGSWYHSFGLEKTVPVLGQNLVLSATVGYADNYWGDLPTLQANTPRSSGWNHYNITAALPIELNCRATLVPYIAYTGAPDSWLADGINPVGVGAQSDVLHGGISLSVNF